MTNIQIQTTTTEQLDQFIQELERALNGTLWTRDRKEERNPSTARAKGSLVLKRPDERPDGKGRPRAILWFSPTQVGFGLNLEHVGPGETNWFLPHWGFAIMANRIKAQDLISQTVLLDLLGPILQAANLVSAKVTVTND